MFSSFEYSTTRFVNVLLGAAAAIIFSLGFLVVADVIGRAVFNSPVKGTTELVSMSIVIISFLLAGHAVQCRNMLQADVLVGAIGPKAREVSAFLSGVLGVLFFGLIVWGSLEPSVHAWVSNEFEGEGALRVPVWPARFVVLAGSALVTIIYAGQAVAAALALLGINDRAPPEATTDLLS
jgi:TRAP-type C4-dicarboxylate transport system permease small subunit